MRKISRLWTTLLQRWQLSLFEKVILVNSIMLLGEAMAGLWITSHNLETHHYLIDTSFIVLATLLTLFTNIFLLRMSFRPLFGLLTTIRAISTGQTNARAHVSTQDIEIRELAQAFNGMLDRLESAGREQTMLILQAQEDERRRIALELHDETGQNLTALLIHTEILHQSVQALPTSAIDEQTRLRVEQGFQQLSRLTQETLEQLRILAQQLRPSVLDDLGLLAAFRWLVEDSQQRLCLNVELVIEGLDFDVTHPLPMAYEMALLRIAQECLTNIARHARAQKASIVLTLDQQHIYLTIQDDGCGYDPKQHHSGSGIVGMRERATLLKGTLSIESHLGKGTTVRVSLPCQMGGEHQRNS